MTFDQVKAELASLRNLEQNIIAGEFSGEVLKKKQDEYHNRMELVKKEEKAKWIFLANRMYDRYEESFSRKSYKLYSERTEDINEE